MIVASSFTQGDPQIDGRTWVFETHVQDAGEPIVFEYLADVGLDAHAVMVERAAAINAQAT